MTPEKAVRLSLANVMAEGMDDVLSQPFEVALIRQDSILQERLRKTSQKRIESFSKLRRSAHSSHKAFERLNLLPISHVLVPKKEAFDFRKVAIIRPQDLVLYQAVAIMIAEPFEAARSKTARGRVFSYRFKPIIAKGQLFSPQHNYRSFQAKAARVSRQESFKYIVRADIANFYDRVNIHRLESTLLTTNGLDEAIASLMNQMLLHWAKRDSYGLPIGSNGSRVLAEVALFNVDKALCEAGLKYVRFVDDYRIFTKTATEAHSALARLMELLDREGLFINSRKSSIERLERTEPGKARDGRAMVRESKAHHRSFRIVAGYGGVIPLKFRAPSRRSEEKLLNIDLNSLIGEIRQNDFSYPEQLRDLLKGIVAQRNFDQLLPACHLVEAFPQFYPMLVDLLIKHAERISAVTRSEIVAQIASKIESDDYLPEFLKASLIHFVGSKEYFDRNSVMKIVRNLPWNIGSYLGRIVLDAAQNLTDRADALEIRDYFDRSNEWERRRIILLMSRLLPNAEYRAWRRAIRTYLSDDHIAVAMK